MIPRIQLEDIEAIEAALKLGFLSPWCNIDIKACLFAIYDALSFRVASPRPSYHHRPSFLDRSIFIGPTRNLYGGRLVFDGSFRIQSRGWMFDGVHSLLSDPELQSVTSNETGRRWIWCIQKIPMLSLSDDQ